MSLIIGIGGISRSGKTWMAYRINELFKHNSVMVINQDNYVFDVEDIPKELFLKRKALDKRWGEFPEWYMEHIWQSYLVYGKVDQTKKGYYFLQGDNINITDDLKDYLLDVQTTGY